MARTKENKISFIRRCKRVITCAWPWGGGLAWHCPIGKMLFTENKFKHLNYRSPFRQRDPLTEGGPDVRVQSNTLPKIGIKKMVRISGS